MTWPTSTDLLPFAALRRDGGPYTFPGVRPFLEWAARVLDCQVGHYGQVERIWHVTQIQHSLGQLAGQAPADRPAAARNLEDVRTSLATALLGVDAAIRDAYTALNIPLPEFLSTEAEPSRTHHPHSPPLPRPGRSSRPSDTRVT